jgi:ribose 5-phosphate isomerase B
MKVAIGSDHRGIEPRKAVAQALKEAGHEVIDLGTHSTESCDYPDIAADVAGQVRDGLADRGVLICGTGIGVSIAANKIRSIRAALCHDFHTAQYSREHNDANVLCLPGDALDEKEIAGIVELWMDTPFAGDRHQRRVEKIAQLECEKS